MKRKKPELSFSEVSLIKKIISTRKAFNLSQEEVARKAGVTRGFIAQFETFYYKPTEKIIKKISYGLNYQGIIEDYEEIKKREQEGINDNYISVLPLVKNLIQNVNEINNKKIGLFMLPDDTLNKVVDIDNMHNVYVYKVDKDLTEFGINKNDNIIIKYTGDFRLSELPGDVLAVITNGKDLIIGKITKKEWFTLDEKNWKVTGIVIAVISQKIMPGALELFL
ncbi:MAG: helix-turn-helix transcriptional regulator [bacterium]